MCVIGCGSDEITCLVLSQIHFLEDNLHVDPSWALCCQGTSRGRWRIKLNLFKLSLLYFLSNTDIYWEHHAQVLKRSVPKLNCWQTAFVAIDRGCIRPMPMPTGCRLSLPNKNINLCIWHRKSFLDSVALASLGGKKLQSEFEAGRHALCHQFAVLCSAFSLRYAGW